jgi:hypothetical protein
MEQGLIQERPEGKLNFSGFIGIHRIGELNEKWRDLQMTLVGQIVNAVDRDHSTSNLP